MTQDACCTCATLLAAVPRVSSSSEKPLPDDRSLDCCGRIICGVCIHRNARFLDYCPYCKTSGRSPLHSRLKHRPRESETEPEQDINPPPYSAIAQPIDTTASSPPPYTPSPASPITSPPPQPNSFSKQPPPPQQQQQENPQQQPEEEQEKPGYTIHHLHHPPHPNPDTLTSLSLQYGIPAALLLRHNNISLDAPYLLAARHTLLIPTAYCTRTYSSASTPTTPGTSITSLSPYPVEDKSGRERKVTIRRWMVACKEWDYDTALVYLEESGYDFAEAVRRYVEDCAWEREHPLESTVKGKGKGTVRRKGLLSAAGGGGGGGGRGGGKVLSLGWLRG